MNKLVTLTFCTVLLSVQAYAATNPWFGTWKLNRDKSHYAGESYTLTKTPNGYIIDQGALKITLVEDGQDHPTLGKYTASLKSTDKNEWLQVVKVSGKEVSRSQMKVSSDGNTLTTTTTGTHEDGSTYKSEESDARVGSGAGLAGTWKSTKETSSSRTVLVVSDAGAGKVKWEFPENKSSYIATPDGKPVPMQGDRSLPDGTIATKTVSSMEVKYTVFEKGKPYVEGTTTVSGDGKVLKDESWLVIKPNEKRTELYEKQ